MKKIAIILSLLFSVNVWAVAPVVCTTKGKELKVNNEQVINWKETTSNQYANRGHITGTLLYNYPDKNGHYHYQVQIGNDNKDTIEVIYNKSFGAIPRPQLGVSFEACGDYITSNAPTSKYEASPDGAILHWVHKSTNPKSHDSGFVIVNGVLYGMKNGIGND